MTQEQELKLYRTKYNDELRKNNTKLYHAAGQRWVLPLLVRMDTIISDDFTYKVVAFREPLKGEFYLSGSVPHAYRALTNQTTKYLVVELTKL